MDFFNNLDKIFSKEKDILYKEAPDDNENTQEEKQDESSEEKVEEKKPPENNNENTENNEEVDGNENTEETESNEEEIEDTNENTDENNDIDSGGDDSFGGDGGSEDLVDFSDGEKKENEKREKLVEKQFEKMYKKYNNIVDKIESIDTTRDKKEILNDILKKYKDNLEMLLEYHKNNSDTVSVKYQTLLEFRISFVYLNQQLKDFKTILEDEN